MKHKENQKKLNVHHIIFYTAQKQMLNNCKYFGNYFGVKSFLITFADEIRS